MQWSVTWKTKQQANDGYTQQQQQQKHIYKEGSVKTGMNRIGLWIHHQPNDKNKWLLLLVARWNKQQKKLNLKLWT